MQGNRPTGAVCVGASPEHSLIEIEEPRSGKKRVVLCECLCVCVCEIFSYLSGMSLRKAACLHLSECLLCGLSWCVVIVGMKTHPIVGLPKQMLEEWV